MLENRIIICRERKSKVQGTCYAKFIKYNFCLHFIYTSRCLQISKISEIARVSKGNDEGMRIEWILMHLCFVMQKACLKTLLIPSRTLNNRQPLSTLLHEEFVGKNFQERKIKL